MIEIQFDQRKMDEALARVGGMERTLSKAVKAALKATAPQVRAEVIGVLVRDVAVGDKFVRRAVKAIRNRETSSEFRVFSKSLFLDDYVLTPREKTARLGMRSKNWPGFSYKLRRNGDLYHSFGTLTGSDGSGSVPFIGRTQSGKLRVMYRRGQNRMGDERVFLAYAPPVQYHAVAPHVEEAARETSMRIFHQKLDHVIDSSYAK